jgi:hypothetical protein
MSPTRRRSLVRLGAFAVTGLLAGCAGVPPRADGGQDDATPRVSVVSVDDDPDLSVRPSVEVVRATATSEHPPRLRTTLANTTDEPVRVGEGRAVHFEYVADDTRDLLLLPSDTEREYPAEPGCWRLTDGIAITEEYRTFEVDPDDSSSRLVDLYGTAGGEGCLPTGEFRFETTIAVLSDELEPRASETWGFVVELA